MDPFTGVEELQVARLLVHRPSRFGYGPVDGVKSELIEELVTCADRRGTVVGDDIWAGAAYFGKALKLAGLTEGYYRQSSRRRPIRPLAPSPPSPTGRRDRSARPPPSCGAR